MKPARYMVRSADDKLPIPDGTQSLERAKEYAQHWARVSGQEHKVEDRGEDGQGAPSVVFTARPPGKEGTPLPRPQNPPPAEPSYVDWSMG